MGRAEVEAFLAHLASEQQVAASTQNQALAALLFLYAHVLEKPLEDELEFPRAKRPQRLPVVFTREEAQAVLSRLSGTKWLMASGAPGVGPG